MTSRNPDGIEDFPSPGCADVAYGPQRLNAIIGASEAFLDPACGTDDLSFHLVPELSATETPSARRHPPAPNWMIWWSFRDLGLQLSRADSRLSPRG
jgi:hypothetical protein